MAVCYGVALQSIRWHGYAQNAQGIHGSTERYESMLMLFHNRRFRFVWLMTLCDEAGLMVYFTVQGWLALMLTDSPFWVGVTSAMNGLALMAFGLLAGVLSDRVNRRLVLTISMTVQAIVAFTTAILIFTDLIELWHLLAIAFFRGSAGAVKLPSRFAIVLDVVERRELLKATAINFVGMSTVGIIIPTFAGLVVQTTDIGWAYVTMGIAWALGPITLIKLKDLQVAKDTNSSPLQDFTQGIRYVFTTNSVRALVLTVFLGDFFGWGVEAMLPVMARDVLNAGPAGVGYMFSAVSAGILISTLVISNIREINKKAVLLVAGYVGFGVSLILFSVSPWLIVSLFLMGLVGLSAGAAETTMDTLLQTTVPDEMRGRVLSFRAFSIGASGSSGFYTGSIALFLGAPLAVAIGGSVLVLNGLRLMKGLSSRFVDQSSPQQET